MKAFLFDSDVLIDILRGNSKTIEKIEALSKDALLYCSAITIGEIYAGMRPKERTHTVTLLDSLFCIAVTGNIAEYGGGLKSKTKSHTLWLDDCLIASTAIAHKLPLLTKNSKHYPFRELEVIKIK